MMERQQAVDILQDLIESEHGRQLHGGPWYACPHPDCVDRREALEALKERASEEEW